MSIEIRKMIKDNITKNFELGKWYVYRNYAMMITVLGEETLTGYTIIRRGSEILVADLIFKYDIDALEISEEMILTPVFRQVIKYVKING